VCDDVVRSGWLSAATRLLDVRRSEKGSLHAPSRHARPTRFRLACAHKRLLRARRCEDAAEEQNGELQCSLSSKVKPERLLGLSSRVASSVSACRSLPGRPRRTGHGSASASAPVAAAASTEWPSFPDSAVGEGGASAEHSENAHRRRPGRRGGA